MDRNKSGWGLLFALGALVGAFLALMFSTDEQGDTKEPVRSKIKDTKTGMRDFKTQRVDPVIQVFEEKTREAKIKFDLAMSQLNAKLVAMKESLKDLDKEKYAQVVDEVMVELKKGGNYTSTQLKRLKDYFIEDYTQITTDAKKVAKK